MKTFEIATLPPVARNDTFVIARSQDSCHCEEHSDEAIPSLVHATQCEQNEIASLRSQ